jgi:hypothetical protein
MHDHRLDNNNNHLSFIIAIIFSRPREKKEKHEIRNFSHQID